MNTIQFFESIMPYEASPFQGGEEVRRTWKPVLS
jgi:hypothetical protein